MRVVACRVAIITHARTLTCDLYLISALLFFLVTFCFWGTCFRVFVFFFFCLNIFVSTFPIMHIIFWLFFFRVATGNSDTQSQRHGS